MYMYIRAHTMQGVAMFKNFLFDIAQLKGNYTPKSRYAPAVRPCVLARALWIFSLCQITWHLVRGTQVCYLHAADTPGVLCVRMCMCMYDAHRYA
jgi:hypothetical protein